MMKIINSRLSLILSFEPHFLEIKFTPIKDYSLMAYTQIAQAYER